MWTYPKHFDLIVLGAGHAGCEAAFAAATMGIEVLLLTSSLDSIAKMSCNPAIGGSAKGQLVREIDALGGLMGKIADRSAIQFRMLNRSRGEAVWAPRAQADRFRYHLFMKEALEATPHLTLRQGTAIDLLIQEAGVGGVMTMEGVFYAAPRVVLSSGTFLKGILHLGDKTLPGGRAADPPSDLSTPLAHHGLRFGRLKTGTPPRIHSRSIDFSSTEIQLGEDDVVFSFSQPDGPRLPQRPCHICYTNEMTDEYIRKHLSRSPMFSGKIKSRGPRYCPSIEDKIFRFPDRTRHQVFLEPEGLNTQEIYVNGLSTSLPEEFQHGFLQTIPALKRVEILRAAYAIEYDFVPSGQIKPTLETRTIPGLFLAGQINGTTGYEEAAAQGLMAGINAALQAKNEPPFILRRDEAYIGVLLDDLMRLELSEPYRMFTSRAEYRLLLRQDNADLRLRHHGYRLGLVCKEEFGITERRLATIAREQKRLESTYIQEGTRGSSLAQVLSRVGMSYQKLKEAFPHKVAEVEKEVAFQLELTAKYSGYIERQTRAVLSMMERESTKIPELIDYTNVTGLGNEAREKLQRIRPHTLGQASRIEGVTAADLSILSIYLQRGLFSPSMVKEEELNY